MSFEKKKKTFCTSPFLMENNKSWDTTDFFHRKTLSKFFYGIFGYRKNSTSEAIDRYRNPWDWEVLKNVLSTGKTQTRETMKYFLWWIKYLFFRKSLLLRAQWIFSEEQNLPRENIRFFIEKKIGRKGPTHFSGRISSFRFCFFVPKNYGILFITKLGSQGDSKFVL